MKPYKSCLIVILACASLNARAAFTDIIKTGSDDPIYEFETLSFTLMASSQAFTQTPISRTEIVSTAVIKQSKFTDKDILKVMAAAYGTNWPGGAKLALDRWSGAIFVVDHTGTNPICNLTAGIHDDVTLAYFICESRVTVYADVGNPRGVFSRQKLYGKILFRLYVTQNDLVYTDLQFDGLAVGDQSVTYKNEVFQSDAATVAGDGLFLDGKRMLVTGQVNGAGKWLYHPGAGPAL
jgi:hypothetical protein